MNFFIMVIYMIGCVLENFTKIILEFWPKLNTNQKKKNNNNNSTP